jgi:CheY-like chemotaxis protein
MGVSPTARTFVRPRNLALRPIPFSKALILCIEDDPIYLHLRKAVLEKEGYNVIGVTDTNTNDALETLREAPACCIIADHMLKGQTGIDAAKERSAQRTFRKGALASPL